MSRPADGILNFKERGYRKMAEFLDDPRALSGLTYVRYKPIPAKSHYPSAKTRHKRARRISVDFATRTHKKHVMHLQHRINCVKILKHLLLRFNLNTFECLIVAPSFKFSRPLYIADLMNKCDMKERTVQNCLLSLTVAGYIKRHVDTPHNFRSIKRHHDEYSGDKHRIFLTPKLFTDIQCDVALHILLRKMHGLAKKNKKKVKNANPVSASQAHQYFVVEETAKPAEVTQSQKDKAAAGHQEFMSQFGRRKKKPPH